MADELEALRKQIEVERGLREAADAENERLVAQVEAYAEDMATLFAEQHGRGREGLSAEVADLRARLEDESAQRQVTARLHKKSAQQVRELSDQLVKHGEDLSHAFREGKRASAAAGRGPWWRRMGTLVPVATTVAGLLLGAGGYATLAPSSSPTADAPLYGPPVPPEFGGSNVLLASGGKLQPLGATTASGPMDPAGIAATAAAAAFGPSALAGGTATNGTPGAADATAAALGTTTTLPEARAATALAAALGTPSPGTPASSSATALAGAATPTATPVQISDRL